MSKYPNVRGLSRGLLVLRAMNVMERGRATPAQLSEATGLHRTTVRRLLETLLEDGFVRRSTSDDTFRLALAVRSLSEGFTDDERVATVAPPIMGQLMQRVVWPSDLTTPDGDAMIIRETTHRFSPLSFHRAMVGRRLPMLFTAAGRAYFGMCPDTEREDILDLLRTRAGGELQQRFASDDAFIRNLVRQTRDNGFGSNHGDWHDQRKIGAVAVAIPSEGRVLASLNVIYLDQTVSPADAVRRFVPPLQDAATQIAAAISTKASTSLSPSPDTPPPAPSTERLASIKR